MGRPYVNGWIAPLQVVPMPLFQGHELVSLGYPGESAIEYSAYCKLSLCQICMHVALQ
jgi:hypothetical protein